jgi:hypothetical protein
MGSIRNLRVSISENKALDRSSSTPYETQYPVAPTHEMTISFEQSANMQTVTTAYVRKENGQWTEVLPCPDPAAIAAAKRKAVENSQGNRQVDEADRALSKKLRSELMNLIATGRKVDAVMLHAKSTGSSIAVSRELIHRLQGSMSK